MMCRRVIRIRRGGVSMWDQSMHDSRQSRAKGVVRKRWESCLDQPKHARGRCRKKKAGDRSVM